MKSTTLIKRWRKQIKDLQDESIRLSDSSDSSERKGSLYSFGKRDGYKECLKELQKALLEEN